MGQVLGFSGWADWFCCCMVTLAESAKSVLAESVWAFTGKANTAAK